MEWVETTGKTLEEALDAALDQLGVADDEAEHEVLDEPKTGLFGRSRGEYRIRARVMPTTPRAKDDRRGRGKTRRPAAAAAAPPDDGAEVSAATEPPAKRSAPRKSPKAARAEERPDEVGPESDDAPAASAPAGDTSDAKGRSTGRPKGRSTRQEPQDKEHTMSETELEVPLAEQGEVAATFLRGLLEQFDLQGDVRITELDEATVEVAIDGDDLGLLIGPKGATLSAIQDLARTVVQRKTAAREGRLLIEVAGYRQKRKEALERFAVSAAEKVRESQTRVVLEPMNASDRKVIHDTVNDIDGVATTSEGEDPRRRVVLFPSA